MCLIPERLSIALQANGWYIRSRIAWCKRSTLPESVQDRPTNAWEHIWMLTKSKRYFYDSFAVRDYSVSEIGHNLWNYWLLSPDPYKGAHTAAFPRELPRRCISAATSEHGNCAECNTPWKRIVEKIADKPPSVNAKNLVTATGGKDTHRLNGTQMKPVTVGWKKQCKCATNEIVAPIVLDPFAGSGTTLSVANMMRRRSIGIEANEEYVKMSLDRIRNGK